MVPILIILICNVSTYGIIPQAHKVSRRTFQIVISPIFCSTDTNDSLVYIKYAIPLKITHEAFI